MEHKSTDVEYKCRICLLMRDDLKPLFEPYCDGPSLAHTLYTIAYVEVEENIIFPKYICVTCAAVIIEFDKLLRTYRENQELLENILVKKENRDSQGANNDLIRLSIKGDCDRGRDYLTDDSIDKEITVNEQESTDFNYENNDVKEIFSNKYECRVCGDSFLMKSGFSLHMSQKHNKTLREDEYAEYCTSISFTVPKVPKEDGDLEMKLVKREYVKKKKGKKSLYECQICKTSFDGAPQLKKHYEVHKSHKCEECGAAFIKKSYLRDHQLMHSNERRYLCKECGKSFKYRNGLAVHRNIHDNYRGFMCDICGAGFSAKTTLKTHIKLKHIGDKNFPCSQCDLSFKVKSWLDKHFLRKHTDNRQKDFVCSMCGVAYLNKTTLTRHISDKHTGTPTRHYCTICEKSYTMKNKLLNHMQNKHSIILNK